MVAALLDEVFRLLKKVDPPLSLPEPWWCLPCSFSSRFDLSAEWFRTAEDIMSRNDRSCAWSGAVLRGAPEEPCTRSGSMI